MDARPLFVRYAEVYSVLPPLLFLWLYIVRVRNLPLLNQFMALTIFSVVLPEDWESAGILCAEIDDCMVARPNIAADVLIVDDGSSRSQPNNFLANASKAIKTIRVLRLRRNLGHQRAIAVALAYVQQKMPTVGVLVMDADGEDRPEDIKRLVGACEFSETAVTVFAERGRRIESISFKLFYACYRLAHRILTGRTIKFGNSSLLPREHLDQLVAYPELWNHYAAAVLKSRLPYTTIRADRGRRLRGESKMNFGSLVINGLSALFASYEVAGTRMLGGNIALALVFCLLLIIVLGVKFFTNLPIPGWAASGLLFILTAQVTAMLLTIIFSVMVSRNSLGFLPIRDNEWFVSDCVEIETQ